MTYFPTVLMKLSHKSGFITIIGRPNVGKSTFLNRVIGQKIAIMSDKPQTTRNTILGVLTKPDCQIIFTDTPGVHKAHSELGERMNEATYSATQGQDAILFMVSAVEPIGTGDRLIINRLKEQKKPVYLLINKVDLLKNKTDIQKIIVSYMNEMNFKEIFPISAKEGINIDPLIDNLKGILQEGPQYYPDDMITDHPERFIIAELIREKLLYFTQEEVPHSIACVVDSMKPSPDEEYKLDVYATIYVERESQKRIVIGSNGALLKKVKDLARRDIKRLLGSRVNLDLWVKVKKDWTNRPDVLKSLGFEKDNF